MSPEMEDLCRQLTALARRALRADDADLILSAVKGLQALVTRTADVERLRTEVDRLQAKIDHTARCPGCPDCIGIGMRQQLNGVTAERDEARRIAEQYRKWALDGASEMPDDLTFPWERDSRG